MQSQVWQSQWSVKSPVIIKTAYSSLLNTSIDLIEY